MNESIIDASPAVPRMVSALDASKITGLSYGYILNGCKRGEIVHIKSNNRFYVNLDRFIDKLNGTEKA